MSSPVTLPHTHNLAPTGHEVKKVTDQAQLSCMRRAVDPARRVAESKKKPEVGQLEPNLDLPAGQGNLTRPIDSPEDETQYTRAQIRLP